MKGTPNKRRSLFLVAIALGSVGVSRPAAAQVITELRVPTSGGRPREIASGPGGMWFTEYGANRIGLIALDGSFSEFAVSSAARGIVGGPDGNLWFTSDGFVSRMTTNGVVTDFLSNSFSFPGNPVSITVGPDHFLWFTDADIEGGLIGHATVAGQITETYIRSFNAPDPAGITWGPDGNLWFTLFGQYGYAGIDRLTPSGALSEFPLPRMSGVWSITAGSDGNLWFTEANANKVGRITLSGDVTEFNVSGGPRGIAAGPDGNLWFTENTGNKIGRISTRGDLAEFEIPTPDSRPWGISAGADGNIWFTELGANQVGRITLDRSPALEMRILPVVGSTPGANGTFFRTSAQIHNSSSAPIAGRIVFHASGVSGGNSDPALFYSLAAGQTQTYADLLPAMGRSGVGSADIEVTSGSAPVAMVRVFNDAGASGTTGFTEEPMRSEDALGPDRKGVLLIPSDLTAFRFNIGVRTLEAATSMTLTVRNASGAIVATVPRSFPAVDHVQQGASEFLEGATLPAGGSVTVAVDSGNAILYGATVDNSTGDPSLQIARAAP